MDATVLQNMWNYYLSIEKDLSETSRYIEPLGQEKVHSFEFAKILVLACTEVEAGMKQLSLLLCGKMGERINDYKAAIIEKYPDIVNAEVTINRWGKTIRPFEDWKNQDSNSPFWWKAYNGVKHNRKENFENATYENAAYSVAALYLTIAYLSATTQITIPISQSNYLDSKYAPPWLLCRAPEMLPNINTYL